MKYNLLSLIFLGFILIGTCIGIIISTQPSTILGLMVIGNVAGFLFGHYLAKLT